MRRIVVASVLVLLCGGSPARAHEILDPIQVNQILRNLQQAKLTLDGNPSADQKEEALFEIGVDAYTLMKLINSDLREHGTENQGLINLAVNRCRALGVTIERPAGEPFYMYDFAAFTSYLALAPKGEHVPEVRFALIEKSFYDANSGQRTLPVLLEEVEQKKRLLEELPRLGRRADLQMFLILDYLELHASYLARNEQTASARYRDLALDLCREVAAQYPNTDAGVFARNLLFKFGL